MSNFPPPPADARWPTAFRRGVEPMFVLARGRKLAYANPAWEEFVGVSLDEAKGLACTRRASGQPLADLGKTLAPPHEVLRGENASVRRPFPGTKTGPPWWDIDFLPVVGSDGPIAILGRIRVAGTTPVAPRATMSADWATRRATALERFSWSRWDDPNLRRVVAQAKLAASSGCATTIVGAIGTGKRTLARTIHAHSLRRELPCVALDCARVPAPAVRTILFGALGLQQPDWVGAIYLNQPDKLPLDLQQELADAIDERPQVMAGFAGESESLHPELRIALGVLRIDLPSLSERRGELSRLAATMNDRLIAPDALALLERHDWPTNLDELRSVLKGADERATGGTIEPAHLPLALRHDAAVTPREEKLPPLDELLERVEKRMIALALERAKGNKSKAADLLGIWRPRLLRRLDALGLAGD